MRFVVTVVAAVLVARLFGWLFAAGRQVWGWLVCAFWHSDYVPAGMHRWRCEEPGCGREWSE